MTISMHKIDIFGGKEKNMDPKIIAVDFDGTLFENKWPDIGEPIMEVIDYVKKEQAAGSKIILWTCRSGMELVNALYYCKKYCIVFDAVNKNLPEIVEKYGVDARKIYADVYIDDMSYNHRAKNVQITIKKSFIQRIEELVHVGYEISVEQIGKSNAVLVRVTKNGISHRDFYNYAIHGHTSDEEKENGLLEVIEKSVMMVDILSKSKEAI